MATRRRGNRREQGDEQFDAALGYLNTIARQARGTQKASLNQLIGDVRDGMQNSQPVNELFARLQQAMTDGILRSRDLADAQIELNNNYGVPQREAIQNNPGRRRRGRIIMPDEMNAILGGPATQKTSSQTESPVADAEDEEEQVEEDEGEEDANTQSNATVPPDANARPAQNRTENRDTNRNDQLDAVERDAAGRPRRYGERRTTRENEERQQDDEQTETNQLDALRNEIGTLRDQIRDLLAQQRTNQDETTNNTPQTGGSGAQGTVLSEGEMVAGAVRQVAQRPPANTTPTTPDAPATPAAVPVPADFQNRLDQLNQNLGAIPDQQAPATGAPATPDQTAAAQVPATPDQVPAQPPTPPAVRDEWPNWPEIRQAPPHPEYMRFVQQLLCQLQAQGINLQPDARLQNAINHMLHARDAHIAGLRGWDTAHGAFAGAGLQGHDRVAAGNAYLMRQNYWGAFEIAMDAFKVELFRFIFDYKRQAFGPQATPEQLRVWARQEGRQIAINCIFPVALTMYEDMERRAAMSLENTRDRNIIQRMGDVWNRMPRWGRILSGAAIAAGIGGLIGAFVGPALALSYGAYRGARALAGGTFAAITQGAVDSWFISPHYQRQRQQLTETGRASAEANINRLASGWEGQGLDWYARYGNLAELMRTIDRDAQLHLQQLNEIARKEGRTRLITGVLTGLAGGFAGGAIYDAWAHPTPVGALVPPSGTKAPLPVETGHGDVVRTIKPGDNLWKVSRGLVADGTITNDQWKDAWQHSTDKVLSHGVEKTVPFHTIGLVHPNDQLIVHHIPDGHVRFDVVDYAKDKLHVGDNAEYARLLQEHGKPLPTWLKEALHISDATPHTKVAATSLAHAAAGVDVAGSHSGPDNIVNFPRATAPEQIVIDNPAPLMKSFPNESLADQDRIMNQLNRQITDLRTELRNPNLPPAFQAHDRELLSKALSLQHDLVGIHDVSLEHFQIAFTTELVDNRNIPWKFYEGVKDIRVADYLWMTDQMHQGAAPGGKIAILGALTDNKDASYSLEKFIREFNPGRFEKKMTLDAFFRHVPPTDSMYYMYKAA